MGPSSRYVIIGGGLAGAQAAETLRAEGVPGPISIVADERHHPYLRPPLSKEYLQGRATRESVFVHPPEWYAEQGIELHLGTAAVTLDPAQHAVGLSDGTRLHYDAALIATGAGPRLLPVAGSQLDGVLYLRRLDDSDAIRAVLERAARIVIVGAGWIGLETAAAARAAGVDVTVVETGTLPLGHVLGPEVAPVFAELHAEHGVRIMQQAHVQEIVGTAGVVSGVRLADGRVLKADAVIVGIGALPNTHITHGTEIKVANGVVVDETLQTTVPDVFAAGDVANAFNRRLDRHIRVEHWDNAKRQGAVAALGMLGRRAVYDRIPFFYSDQYDVGLEYTGFAPAGAYDRVVFRGDVPGHRFTAFWMAGARIVAGMNVNTWDIRPAIEALIESGQEVDDRVLADEDVPLEAVGVN
jgi:3-phenylpropionate/trans-cinnamate dioxygenase ferredoxin reductase component